MKTDRFALLASALLIALGFQALQPTAAVGQNICIVMRQNGIEYSFNKLRINIERQGGELRTVNPTYQSTSEALHDITGAILFLHQADGTSITERAFSNVLDHVKSGGRAVIFVTEMGASTYSELILDSLRTATKTTNGLFAETSTPNYIKVLGNGRIGADPVQYQRGDVTRTYNPEMANVFFLPPLIDKDIVLEKSTVQDLETEKQKVVSLRMRHGKGELILTTSPQTKEGFANPFFSDTNFDKFDNRKITTRLVRWLISPGS